METNILSGPETKGEKKPENFATQTTIVQGEALPSEVVRQIVQAGYNLNMISQENLQEAIRSYDDGQVFDDKNATHLGDGFHIDAGEQAELDAQDPRATVTIDTGDKKISSYWTERVQNERALAEQNPQVAAPGSAA